MGKIYTTNMDSLMEFIVDLNNKYKINVSSEGEIKRIPKRKGEPYYRNILVGSYHKEFVPVYNIMNDLVHDKTYLYVDIPDVELLLQLKYTDNSVVCSFSFEIPSTRIIDEINLNLFTLPSNKIKNVYKEIQAYIDAIVTQYIKDSISSIASGQMFDKANDWALSGDLSFKLERKVNL